MCVGVDRVVGSSPKSIQMDSTLKMKHMNRIVLIGIEDRVDVVVV